MPLPRRLAVVLVVVALALLAGSSPAGAQTAPPANDDIANAVTFASLPFSDTRDISGATRAAGDSTSICVPSDEIVGSDYDRSVWYRFTPASSGWVEATAAISGAGGRPRHMVLAAFVETSSGLADVACHATRYLDGSTPRLQARVGLAATAGSTYLFSAAADLGTLSFAVDSSPPSPPDNDDFDAAAIIDPLGSLADTVPDARRATAAADDPVASCGAYERSVWYRYTAPAGGTIQLDAGRSYGYDATLAVYSGTRESLSELACVDSVGHVPETIEAFDVAAGETYHILVGTKGTFKGVSVEGSVDTSLPFAASAALAGPANDAPDGAVSGTLPFAEERDVRGSTAGANDPAASCAASYGHSVWYTLTSTLAGPAFVSTDGSTYDTVAAVYTGTPGALTEVACSDDADGGSHSRASFAVAADTTYHVLIAAKGSGVARTLRVDARFVPPANDNFADATVIDGLPFTASADIAGATREESLDRSAFDRCGGFQPQGRSVWYAYTPAREMTIAISTEGSGYHPAWVIAELGDSGTPNPHFCSSWPGSESRMRGGTTYYIGVDAGAEVRDPNLVFNARAAGTPPANDDFDDALAITELPFLHLVDQRAAAKEADDPRTTCDPARDGDGLMHNLWYAFTPEHTGRVRMMDHKNDSPDWSLYPPVAAVYSGTRGNLTEIACNNFRGSANYRLDFDVTAGRTYYIMVGDVPQWYVANNPLVVYLFYIGDTTPPPPPPVLTLREDEPDEHAAGTTLFYNPAGDGGTFVVTAEASDPESGLCQVDFPAVGSTGAMRDDTRPFSQEYRADAGGEASGTFWVEARNDLCFGARINSSSFTVTPDGAGPTVEITAPASAATVGNGQEIAVTATDAGAGVAEVEVFACAGTSCDPGAGSRLGTAAPGAGDGAYVLTWTDPPALGTYTLVARAVDHVGNATGSAPVTVQVGNDDTPPTGPPLTLIEREPDEHAAGTRLYYNPSGTNSGRFTVVAKTDDPESGIAGVRFPEVFGGDAGTDATSPYKRTYAWSAGASARGAKTVTASNGFGAVFERRFTVIPDAAKPKVAITAPIAGAAVTSGQVIEVRAADSGAGVAKVQVRFCPGNRCPAGSGTVIAGDTRAPYAVTWRRLPAAGTYTLVAEAVDRVGNPAVSKPVRVTVGGAGTAGPEATGALPSKTDTAAPAVTPAAAEPGNTLSGRGHPRRRPRRGGLGRSPDRIPGSVRRRRGVRDT